MQKCLSPLLMGGLSVQQLQAGAVTERLTWHPFLSVAVITSVVVTGTLVIDQLMSERLTRLPADTVTMASGLVVIPIDQVSPSEEQAGGRLTESGVRGFTITSILARALSHPWIDWLT